MYVPTGFTEFMNITLEAAAKQGEIPAEVMRNVVRFRGNDGNWVERVSKGRRYNLVTMFSVLCQNIPSMHYMAINIFIPLALSMPQVKFEWFSTFYNYLTSIGDRRADPATNTWVQWINQYANSTMDALPHYLRTGVIQGILNYGSTFTAYAFSLGITLLGGIVGSLIMWITGGNRPLQIT
jgi:hypothetical protein